MSAFKDLTGIQFGRLHVLEPVENFGGPRKWKCVCNCGKIVEVRGSHMTAGATKSCGCFSADATKARSTTHGQSHKTPEYKTWVNIRARCCDPKHISFKYYGAKGIQVCKRWDSFENFFSDMGVRPSKDHSIDRTENDGNYEPNNCRWATESEQQSNKSDSRFLTSGGKTHTVAMWEKIRGFKKGTIYSRLYLGWSDNDAIWRTPMARQRRSRENT